MSIDLKGIENQNEYYTNNYFATDFEADEQETLHRWREEAKNDPAVKTPWARLRNIARRYGVVHEEYLRNRFCAATLQNIVDMADRYLAALGYPQADPQDEELDEPVTDSVDGLPVYLKLTRPNGASHLWVLLTASFESDDNILDRYVFDARQVDETLPLSVASTLLLSISNEDLIQKIFFQQQEPPRFLLFVGIDTIALIDRNKWNQKRFLSFNLDDIFGRREETTLQAMAVLLHRESLAPDEGRPVLDDFDEVSLRNASGVSEDLKYALRESIELLGNEVLYDLEYNKGQDFETDPVDASELTLECLRYMYRMLFVFFIESRNDLGYAPMKSQVYFSAYSLEHLREIEESVRADLANVGDGTYLFESLEKLYQLIYDGYPKTEEEMKKLSGEDSIHDVFHVEPLKAHIFDPERTPMITHARIRNKVMLQIIDKMSMTRGNGKKGGRARISYANLGINQMGAVYEALLSYRGFIAQEDLYEVKKATDKEVNTLDVGYFVTAKELDNYTEEERVYVPDEVDPKKKHLKIYPKGTFIYRLAGREREKSASFYTPESLTHCLVKYALKELLTNKSADEILNLKICEPAMGSAAFLNEVISQLSEAYLDRKQGELGEVLSAERRPKELRKVKMYIADRDVYGIDLNPTAVELAEVSLWLNTIYEGAFVPWFGTQLVNGNSLIGARKECYDAAQLETTSKGMRWFENEPERVPVGKKRVKKRQQVYHFLVGDPGMASYNDKVIKSLEPEKIRRIDTWHKDFNRPYTDDDVALLLELSDQIDVLWDKQVELRRQIDKETNDKLNVYGHRDSEGGDSHTTIRQKDEIYSKLYKSEHMKNAGPYARLKFAMDYWCALWFWPIDKADLLPSRSEFLFDMTMIINGTKAQTWRNEGIYSLGQMNLFDMGLDNPSQETVRDILSDNEVDIDKLCKKSERLALVRKIADEQKFMHWELEFADVFADRDGFDLILGNPPWIKITWKEEGVLSDANPMFAVKKLTATQTIQWREEALSNQTTRKMYFSEYESMSAQQNFLNAVQNYPVLKGQQTNLYKCFLPQAWKFDSKKGCSAFIHPDGVYDDPQGGILRRKLYPRLRRHFQFINEYKLFEGVHHNTSFSVNIYGPEKSVKFDTISNLYSVAAVDQCYDTSIKGDVPGIKDENGNWNTKGHPGRVVHIGPKEMSLFAQLFDGNDHWKEAKLPVIHAQDLLDVLGHFADQSHTLASKKNEITVSEMWHETNSQKNGIIKKDIHFPLDKFDAIYSGPHISIANPIFKCARRKCELNSDYDAVDLLTIPENYIQRCKYRPACEKAEYLEHVQDTSWGTKYINEYRIVSRKMMASTSTRTLMPCIISPGVGHVNNLFGMAFQDNRLLALFIGYESSVPFDFYIKITGKSNGIFDVLSGLPLLDEFKGKEQVILRSLLLNCLTAQYSGLWLQDFNIGFCNDHWAKEDPRLRNEHFNSLSSEWNWNTPLRTDYERREAMVEIDVLTAMALGMTLEQLKTIYRIQFPILQQFEADTWYDANGRIVFTTNRSLNNVGFSRVEWENGIKGAPAGKVFTRTITDDTMPGGPVERTIEYVAPFDKCDRIQDYETAWAYFEKKFGFADA